MTSTPNSELNLDRLEKAAKRGEYITKTEQLILIALARKGLVAQSPAAPNEPVQALPELPDLIAVGALRQLQHNDGSEGFVFAYDKTIVDREMARLGAAIASCRALPVKDEVREQSSIDDGPTVYTCIGKGGEYLLLGTATGAGTSRGAPDLRIYMEADNPLALYYRTAEDFNNRMAASSKGEGDG